MSVNPWHTYNFKGVIDSEWDVLQDILKESESGDTFWDIGSHIGVYSAFMSQSDAEVYAFEPDPRAYELVQKNLELNHGGTAINTALSNEETTAKLDGVEISAADGIPVKLRLGDDIRVEEGIPSPDIIKIDVEGLEYEVLDGLTQTLSDVSVVYLEHHEQMVQESGRNPEEVLGILRDHGFELTSLLTHNHAIHYKAANHSVPSND